MSIKKFKAFENTDSTFEDLVSITKHLRTLWSDKYKLSYFRNFRFAKSLADSENEICINIRYYFDEPILHSGLLPDFKPMIDSYKLMYDQIRKIEAELEAKYTDYSKLGQYDWNFRLHFDKDSLLENKDIQYFLNMKKSGKAIDKFKL